MAMADEPGIEVLADRSRRRIIRMLNDHPHRPSTMARELGLDRSTITYHLRILEAAGLVRLLNVRMDDRSGLYAIEPSAERRILAWFRETGLDESLPPPGYRRRAGSR